VKIAYAVKLKASFTTDSDRVVRIVSVALVVRDELCLPWIALKSVQITRSDPASGGLDFLNIFDKVMKKKIFFYYRNSIPYHRCVRKKQFFNSTPYQKKDISVSMRKNYGDKFKLF
jgi:hypothetical protein